jgi:hypothetical protein
MTSVSLQPVPSLDIFVREGGDFGPRRNYKHEARRAEGL